MTYQANKQKIWASGVSINNVKYKKSVHRYFILYNILEF